MLIQNIRESGWTLFHEKVTALCKHHHQKVSNTNDNYIIGQGGRTHDRQSVTIKHHY